MPSRSPQLDTTITVVTPENIGFQYQVAGPFRRFLAFGIDHAIKLFLYFLLVIAAVLLASVMGTASIGMGLVVYFLIDWFYGGVFEACMNGRTPGKWILGIRVLTVDGRPINGLQAIMRNVLRYADSMPMLPPQVLFQLGVNEGPMQYLVPTFLIGLVVMSISGSYQRLGDLVCGTLVVIEERHWLTGVAKIDDPRAFQLAGLLPADFVVSRSLAEALSHYVERRRFFSPARRREVARCLGEPLLALFGLRSDTSHDLLLCALYYRTFIADPSQDERHISAAALESPFQPLAPVAAIPPTVSAAGPGFPGPVGPTLTPAATGTGAPSGTVGATPELGIEFLTPAAPQPATGRPSSAL